MNLVTTFINGDFLNLLDYNEVKVITGDKADGKTLFPRQYVELFQRIGDTNNYGSNMWVDTLYLNATGYELGDSYDDSYYTMTQHAKELRDIIDTCNKEIDWKGTYWTYHDGKSISIDLTKPVEILATID
jgi:hypothetical protein